MLLDIAVAIIVLLLSLKGIVDNSNDVYETIFQLLIFSWSLVMLFGVKTKHDNNGY